MIAIDNFRNLCKSLLSSEAHFVLPLSLLRPAQRHKVQNSSATTDLFVHRGGSTGLLGSVFAGEVCCAPVGRAYHCAHTFTDSRARHCSGARSAANPTEVGDAVLVNCFRCHGIQQKPMRACMRPSARHACCAYSMMESAAGMLSAVAVICQICCLRNPSSTLPEGHAAHAVAGREHAETASCTRLCSPV